MTTHPHLDPELASVVAAIPPFELADLAAMRETIDALPEPGQASDSYAGVELQVVFAPGLNGAPDVPIRMMRPSGASGPLPVLLAMHGGGFVLGRAQDFDYFCLEAVRTLGITVANVEYRLAPETPFPGPLDDCAAALRYLHENGESLGIDANRMAVGGSSAGGGLAAGLVLRTRDEGGPHIAFQLLLSPALDDRRLTPSSSHADEWPVLTSRAGELVWRHYLGAGYAGPDDTTVSAYAAPARADDLAGLPPTYITAMELDPVRDENLQYAFRLLEAGVSVELHSHPGTFHGSAEFAPQAASSVRILRGMLDALGRGLSA